MYILFQRELNFANANYLEYAIVQLTPPSFNLYYQMLTHIKISGYWMENKPLEMTITDDQKEAYEIQKILILTAPGRLD